MLELGSIHPDEQSARRAVATLIGAGIEPERVKLLRPRVALPPQAEPPADPPTHWKGRARDVVGGAGFGMIVGALACVLITVIGARWLSVAPLGVYAWVLGTAMVAGAAAALVIHLRYLEMAPLVQPRPRRTARGWAVIVHARDVDQRALAARALAGHAA